MIDDIQKENEKGTLRLNLKKARDSVTQNVRLHARKAIVEQVDKLPCYKQSKKVGLYLNTPAELDTGDLLSNALKTGKDIYCPVISDSKKGLMSFKKYSKDLVKNAFGIEEPSATNPTLDSQELCLMFIPLLGFDLNGERLGMGGGYYDRLLSFKQTNFKSTAKKVIKPYLIGLAFDAQCVDSIPTQSWDIRLDAVITESKTHIFNPTIRSCD